MRNMSNRHIIGNILLHTFTLYYSYTRRQNNEHAASTSRAALKNFKQQLTVKQEMKYYVEYKFNKQAVRIIACFIDEVFSATVSVVY